MQSIDNTGAAPPRPVTGVSMRRDRPQQVKVVDLQLSVWAETGFGLYSGSKQGCRDSAMAEALGQSDSTEIRYRTYYHIEHNHQHISYLT